MPRKDKYTLSNLLSATSDVIEGVGFNFFEPFPAPLETDIISYGREEL